MIRFHYHHQMWLASPEGRRWQRFHLFRPWGRCGLGVTVWAHEFSIGWAARRDGE